MELSPENQRIIQQLSDMFRDVSPSNINQVCCDNRWNVEHCIDQLISMSSDRALDAQHEASWQWPKEDKTSEKSNYQQGAIPKSAFSDQAFTNDNSPKREQMLANNNKQTGLTNSALSAKRQSAEQNISQKIRAGYKVMVIMRGAPGSGKSTLATQIVESTVPLNGVYGIQDFIFSSDDYFYDRNGRYKYNPDKLPEAHSFNIQRVREKAMAGLSPIVVDNTNIKLWEMFPYVKTAVQNGYIIELLEPSTPWRNSPGKLALKTLHRVPREKIQQMINNFEKVSVKDLLKMVKDHKSTMSLPQMRRFPPLTTSVDDTEKIANQCTEQDKPMKPETSKTELPQPQRSRSSSKLALKLPDHDEKINNQDSPSTAWKPFDQETNNFWGIAQKQTTNNMQSETDPPSSEKTLLDLLKEGVSDIQVLPANNEEAEKRDSFERHKINCPNENKCFQSLRQIYPNKQLSGLWDLFVKCNGDIDWSIDILLKEDELIDADQLLVSENHYKLDEDIEHVLTCNCDGDRQTLPKSSKLPEASQTNNNSKPQRPQRSRMQRINQNPSTALLDVKETIESRVVLSNEHYSNKVNKIRNLRSGFGEKGQKMAEKCGVDIETQTEPVETEEDLENDESELMEIILGESFVTQLSNIFAKETLDKNLSDDLKTKVFMPRSLAKELYMLWMESVYNQMEEKRLNTLREDEEFARLLKNPKYENFKESPENVREILDMELAWMIYKNDNEEIQKAANQQPNDMASYLTLIKLCEIFPNIPRETLVDILEANGNKFNKTVEVLQSNMDMSAYKSTTQNQLLERAMHENELLNNQVEDQKQHYQKYPMHSNSNAEISQKSPILPEESKRLALKEFEESRNFAAHHCQLKAECYQKAKEAIQRGNCGVALYYSQISNLHKKKIDMYNHRAANCIMEVHEFSHNNPDLLDLHYLYMIEAVTCLDLFLDRHITKLRSLGKSYKHVFIITGRGLHSFGGISIIKSKVKNRLKERSLRWSEVNPGLLKVKLFWASRYSKNI